MKKLISFLSIVFIGIALLHTQTSTAATSDISIVINGETQNYDQPPVIIDNRTLVPLRGIFETLDAHVSWNGETRTVKAGKGSTTMSLKIGSNQPVVNGKPVAIDVPAQILNSRTYVPLRFISEVFDASVGWNGTTRTVTILYSQPLTNDSNPQLDPINDNGEVEEVKVVDIY